MSADIVHRMDLILTNDYALYNGVRDVVLFAMRGETDAEDARAAAGDAVAKYVSDGVEISSGLAAALLAEILYDMGSDDWRELAESFYDEDDVPTGDEDDDETDGEDA